MHLFYCEVTKKYQGEVPDQKPNTKSKGKKLYYIVAGLASIIVVMAIRFFSSKKKKNPKLNSEINNEKVQPKNEQKQVEHNDMIKEESKINKPADISPPKEDPEKPNINENCDAKSVSSLTNNVTSSFLRECSPKSNFNEFELDLKNCELLDEEFHKTHYYSNLESVETDFFSLKDSSSIDNITLNNRPILERIEADEKKKSLDIEKPEENYYYGEYMASTRATESDEGENYQSTLVEEDAIPKTKINKVNDTTPSNPSKDFVSPINKTLHNPLAKENDTIKDDRLDEAFIQEYSLTEEGTKYSDRLFTLEDMEESSSEDDYIPKTSRDTCINNNPMSYGNYGSVSHRNYGSISNNQIPNKKKFTTREVPFQKAKQKKEKKGLLNYFKDKCEKIKDKACDYLKWTSRKEVS